MPRRTAGATTGASVVLDNEAVVALRDPGHRKHRRALAVVEGARAVYLAEGEGGDLIVPTSVRAEAGWDRRDHGAAGLNRLRARDHDLDTTAANSAAALRSALGVSVPDAHLGVVMASLPTTHAVVTSDVPDVRRMADHLGTSTRVIRL